jgi:LysR family transcriptional regulator, benzoate and cis,cis-muconate-responsive activator of ben and cat genes
MIVELRQLRYFVAVADEGNLSGAARLLNVSQPPVTRQIHPLEEEIGQKLFVRTPKGVVLTAAGAALLTEARKILAQINLATERANAAAMGKIGRLNIGYFGSIIYSYLPAVVRRFRALTPGAEISLHPVAKTAQFEALRDRQIHVGFSRYYPYEADMVVERVGWEKLFFAVPEGSASARRKAVKLDDLRDERLVLFPKEGRPNFADEVITLFSRVGRTPHVMHIEDDVSAALALTAAGLASTFVPESMAAISWPGVVFLPVVGTDISLPIECISLREGDSPILKAFMKAVRPEGRQSLSTTRSRQR